MKNIFLQLTGVLSLLCLFVFSQAAAAAEDNPDPWENWNRKVYNFNDTIDSNFLRPIAKGYKDYTPNIVQSGVSNVFSNFGEISNITNNALQGKKNGFVASTWRFVINSTVGIFGLFDVASALGLRQYDEDFGQTLGYWGVSSGPYVVLPFFGPSTVRDAGGLVVDYSNYHAQDEIGLNRDQRWGLRGLNVVEKRASYLSAENMIIGDPYSFVRDVYLQARANEVYDGHPPQNKVQSSRQGDSSTDSWGDDDSATDSWGDDSATDSWGDPDSSDTSTNSTQPVPQTTDSWGDSVPADKVVTPPVVKPTATTTLPAKADSSKNLTPQNTDSAKNTQ